MVGRRGKDFRSGDWNEDLGILLLKAFAAVAPVQRQEDFGLDAVATLLRHDEQNRLLYAEDSFYVQLKNESKKNVDYEGEEIQWLKWKTNKAPTLDEGHFVALGRPPDSDFCRIVESLIPGLHALALHADATKNRAEMRALVCLTQELKNAGFHFDELDDFEDRLTEWKSPKPFFDEP